MCFCSSSFEMWKRLLMFCIRATVLKYLVGHSFPCRCEGSVWNIGTKTTAGARGCRYVLCMNSKLHANKQHYAFLSHLGSLGCDDKGIRLTQPENPNLSGAIPCENEHHIACLGSLRHNKVKHELWLFIVFAILTQFLSVDDKISTKLVTQETS